MQKRVDSRENLTESSDSDDSYGEEQNDYRESMEFEQNKVKHSAFL